VSAQGADKGLGEQSIELDGVQCARVFPCALERVQNRVEILLDFKNVA
jgi:hypothetical protein